MPVVIDEVSVDEAPPERREARPAPAREAERPPSPHDLRAMLRRERSRLSRLEAD